MRFWSLNKDIVIRVWWFKFCLVWSKKLVMRLIWWRNYVTFSPLYGVTLSPSITWRVHVFSSTKITLSFKNVHYMQLWIMGGTLLDFELDRAICKTHYSLRGVKCNKLLFLYVVFLFNIVHVICANICLCLIYT